MCDPLSRGTVWDWGKGPKITIAKNIGFVVFLMAGGWWGKIYHHSGWLKMVSCIFKATILWVAVETSISGEGRKEKEKEERVQWDFFFPFSFYIKVLRPQWKNFIHIYNKPLCELQFLSVPSLEMFSHGQWLDSIMPKDIGHTVKQTNKTQVYYDTIEV